MTASTNPRAAAAAEFASTSLERQRAFQRGYLEQTRAAIGRRLTHIAELARLGRPRLLPYNPNARRAEQARAR